MPIISSCNLKMNDRVPFIASISSQASEKWRSEGGFVFCSVPVLNLECKRSQRALEFSGNPIPQAKMKNPFPADTTHVEGR